MFLSRTFNSDIRTVTLRKMAAALASPSTSKLSVPEHVLHKNRLQEYTQRSAIPLPIYQTINEGSPHAPRFRSTVVVDGASYVSMDTFSQRKEAEQAVAKYALELISEKIKNEGCALIVEDTIFCKSILNEYAVKMSLEKPLYKTTQSSGLLPLFFSTLCFNGKLYTGGAGRNKKEAEQLAARTVIQSILVESSSGRCLTEIIKSKGKLYAAMHKIKDSGASTSERRVVVVPPVINKLPMPAYSGTCQGQLAIAPVIQSSVHELKKPKVEPSSEATTSFTGAFQPAPHVHQPHPNQVQNEVPLAQPSSANFGGTSQGIIVQNEVPLALPSAVNVRDSSQGIVFVQHEVPLPLPSAVNVRDSSQGIVVVQNEVPLTDPSAVGSSSQGTVVTSPGVKRPRKKNKRGGKKRFRNEGSQFSMPAVNQTTSCSVAH